MRTRHPRKLIWFPIVHTQQDLGSLGGSVQRVAVRHAGKARWEWNQQRIDAFWKAIGDCVVRLDLDYSHVHLYQDGLPLCSYEAKIVTDLAAAGSQNHRLLLDLMARGATLVGTESPDLLVREYVLTQQWLETLETRGRTAVDPRLQEMSREILLERDRFIGERIAQTLHPGQVGLLFLGMLHAPAEYLPPDIDFHKTDITDDFQRNLSKPRPSNRHGPK